MLKTITVVALFLSPIGAFADSQPPSPSDGTFRSQPEPKAAASPAEAKRNQRGTEDAPLIVQELRTPERDKEAADETDAKKHEATDNHSLVWITGIIAVAAILQWVALLWQSILTRQSIRIAERTLTEIERPYFYVFGPYRLETAPDIMMGFVPFVKCTFANYGKTPASVRRIRMGFSVGKEGPDSEVTDATTAWRMQTPIYANGREQEFRAELLNTIDHDEMANGEIVPKIGRDEFLFLRIIVNYAGPLTGNHETAARWVWSHGNNRFSEFGESKYNYRT